MHTDDGGISLRETQGRAGNASVHGECGHRCSGRREFLLGNFQIVYDDFCVCRDNNEEKRETGAGEKFQSGVVNKDTEK